jgi:hypothetical protein
MDKKLLKRVALSESGATLWNYEYTPDRMLEARQRRRDRRYGIREGRVKEFLAEILNDAFQEATQGAFTDVDKMYSRVRELVTQKGLQPPTYNQFLLYLEDFGYTVKGRNVMTEARPTSPFVSTWEYYRFGQRDLVGNGSAREMVNDIRARARSGDDDKDEDR